MAWLEDGISKAWQSRGVVSTALWPLGAVFAGVTAVRRHAYASGWARSEHAGVPTLVVGNITVGGVGKTPVVVDLIERLQAIGRTPAVIARGYGGDVGPTPRLVTADSVPSQVGDEPLMIVRRTGCIAAVHPDRPAAARLAVQAGADCIVCDDGLQHYRLQRDCSIVVVDGQRGFGNGRLLPAGPLREPLTVMGNADLLVSREQPLAADVLPQSANTLDQVCVRVEPTGLQSVQQPGDAATGLQELQGLQGKTVHAVAGIGYPGRFFGALEQLGATVVRHAFGDHHAFAQGDFTGYADEAVVMTEKDAVKCAPFALPHWRFLSVSARYDAPHAVDDLLAHWLRTRLPEQHL